MTIRHDTHVTGAKPRHAAMQRQAPRQLAPARPEAVSALREKPVKSRINPRSTSRAPARSGQPHLATVPQPRNIGLPNLLSP